MPKKIAADEVLEVDEETARKIEGDSYVDDNLSGGTQEESDKMVGNCTKTEDGKFTYDGTVSQILAKVGLAPKVIVRSGETDPEALNQLGGRVLGHIWDASNDWVVYLLSVNISKKIRNVRSGPALTEETLDQL